MVETSKTLAERCAGIEMLVLDVDGVLTDGSIIYNDTGMELKKFHVRDGSGLKVWHKLGKRAAIITGRSSRAVDIRAAELEIAPVIQGAASKCWNRPGFVRTRCAPWATIWPICRCCGTAAWRSRSPMPASKRKQMHTTSRGRRAERAPCVR
jgi:hypothetical protein